MEVRRQLPTLADALPQIHERCCNSLQRTRKEANGVAAQQQEGFAEQMVRLQLSAAEHACRVGEIPSWAETERAVVLLAVDLTSPGAEPEVVQAREVAERIAGSLCPDLNVRVIDLGSVEEISGALEEIAANRTTMRDAVAVRVPTFHELVTREAKGCTITAEMMVYALKGLLRSYAALAGMREDTQLETLARRFTEELARRKKQRAKGPEKKPEKGPNGEMKALQAKLEALKVSKAAKKKGDTKAPGREPFLVSLAGLADFVRFFIVGSTGLTLLVIPSGAAIIGSFAAVNLVHGAYLTLGKFGREFYNRVVAESIAGIYESRERAKYFRKCVARLQDNMDVLREDLAEAVYDLLFETQYNYNTPVHKIDVTDLVQGTRFRSARLVGCAGYVDEWRQSCLLEQAKYVEVAVSFVGVTSPKTVRKEEVDRRYLYKRYIPLPGHLSVIDRYRPTVFSGELEMGGLFPAVCSMVSAGLTGQSILLTAATRAFEIGEIHLRGFFPEAEPFRQMQSLFCTIAERDALQARMAVLKILPKLVKFLRLNFADRWEMLGDEDRSTYTNIISRFPDLMKGVGIWALTNVLGHQMSRLQVLNPEYNYKSYSTIGAIAQINQLIWAKGSIDLEIMNALITLSSGGFAVQGDAQWGRLYPYLRAFAEGKGRRPHKVISRLENTLKGLYYRTNDYFPLSPAEMQTIANNC